MLHCAALFYLKPSYAGFGSPLRKVELFHFYYSFQLSHLKEFVPRIYVDLRFSYFYTLFSVFRGSFCFEDIARVSLVMESETKQINFKALGGLSFEEK